VVLVGLIFAFLLLFGFMVLHFGHDAAKMFLPYVTGQLKVLLTESRKTHPAIRVEMLLHALFGCILLFCLVMEGLHASVSSVLNEQTTRHLPAVLISSFMVLVLLTIVSIMTALRVD
jgi:hypothetical protein